MSYYGDDSTRRKMNDLRYEINDFVDEVTEEESRADAITKLLQVVNDVVKDLLYDDCTNPYY